MDTLSHSLWGRLLFGRRVYPWLAFFFGAMPDLFSFGLLFLIRIGSLQFHSGPPPLETIPWWVFVNYNISHSFLSAFAAIIIVSRFNSQLAFAMLAWPFHILLDFPFHTLAFFPTKIFWPLSDFVVDGIPWSHPAVWFPNVAGIIIVYFYGRKKRKNRL
ncbi:MAG: hypothetical protein V3S48_06985 [Candidatus Neomarinimicrobiota bacterium]